MTKVFKLNHSTFQIAARNCRKRKGEQILVLEEEIEIIRRQKQSLIYDRNQLLNTHLEWSSKLQFLEARLLDTMLGAEATSSRLQIQGDQVTVIRCAS